MSTRFRIPPVNNKDCSFPWMDNFPTAWWNYFLWLLWNDDDTDATQFLTQSSELVKHQHKKHLKYLKTINSSVMHPWRNWYHILVCGWGYGIKAAVTKYERRNPIQTSWNREIQYSLAQEYLWYQKAWFYTGISYSLGPIIWQNVLSDFYQKGLPDMIGEVNPSLM